MGTDCECFINCECFYGFQRLSDRSKGEARKSNLEAANVQQWSVKRLEAQTGLWGKGCDVEVPWPECEDVSLLLRSTVIVWWVISISPARKLQSF